MPPVLLVEDSEHDSRHLSLLVADSGFECLPTAPGDRLLERLEQTACSLVLIGSLPAETEVTSFATSLQTRVPAIPVVVLTSDSPARPLTMTEPGELPSPSVHELRAKEALQSGVAGCLPRRFVDSDLAWTLQTIFYPREGGASDAANGAAGVMCYTIENTPDLLPLVVAQVRRRMEEWQVSDPMELVRTTVALSEVLDNALYHGNLELNSELRQGDGRAWRNESLRRQSIAPYSDRRIRFHARFDNHSARFVVRDDGPGFDRGSLDDCTDIGNLERCSGRGLLLMKMYMDEIAFNAAGNEVTLTKHRP